MDGQSTRSWESCGTNGTMIPPWDGDQEVENCNYGLLDGPDEAYTPLTDVMKGAHSQIPRRNHSQSLSPYCQRQDSLPR